jgi:hypothetical protein
MSEKQTGHRQFKDYTGSWIEGEEVNWESPQAVTWKRFSNQTVILIITIRIKMNKCKINIHDSTFSPGSVPVLFLFISHRRHVLQKDYFLWRYGDKEMELKTIRSLDKRSCILRSAERISVKQIFVVFLYHSSERSGTSNLLWEYALQSIGFHYPWSK